MNKRFNEILSAIPKCEVFADIGCDHGYMSKAVFEIGKCRKIIASDVSDKCLEKARILLAKEIAGGNAKCIVSDGFDNLPKADCALIAGMGGEEIILILKKAKNLPEKLVLQPMKNTQKLREFALSLGYKIEKDYLFKSGKIFYDLLVLGRGEHSLSKEEIEFGRTNLQTRSEDFRQYILEKIKNLEEYSRGEKLAESTKNNMLCEIERLKKYV